MLAEDYGEPFEPNEYEGVANSQSPWHRFGACLALVVWYGKHCRDLSSSRSWANKANALLRELRLTEFSAQLHESIFLRSAAFVPLLSKDYAGMVDIMQRCEAIARELKPNTAREEKAAQENLMTVLESRSKEALALGETSLSAKRAQEMLSLDPLDSKNHLEYADALEKIGEYDKAQEAYLTAARLGMPATAVAFFNLGQLYERRGDAPAALEAYRRSAESDSFSPVVFEAIVRTATAAGQNTLNVWARAHLDFLSSVAK